MLKEILSRAATISGDFVIFVSPGFVLSLPYYTNYRRSVKCLITQNKKKFYPLLWPPPHPPLGGRGAGRPPLSGGALIPHE